MVVKLSKMVPSTTNYKFNKMGPYFSFLPHKHELKPSLIVNSCKLIRIDRNEIRFL